MGSIQIRSSSPEPVAPVAPAPTLWEPSRLMSRMMAWDPFREMAPFLAGERLALEPAFEVKETKDSYLFKADVPGITAADLDVAMTGNRLTISGKREAIKEDKGDRYYTHERSYGSFTRSFTMPGGVNTAGIRADLDNGVLTVVVPKALEAVAKTIPIAAPNEPKKG